MAVNSLVRGAAALFILIAASSTRSARRAGSVRGRPRKRTVDARSPYSVEP